MGAWGSGPFDNDDAADWAYQLTDDADEAVVGAALAAVVGDSSPDAPTASCAIAAAEVVAAGLGRPHPELPDEVADWVAARRDRPWAGLVPSALAALDRVASDSELSELWGDAEDAAWGEEVDDLRARLGEAG